MSESEQFWRLDNSDTTVLVKGLGKEMPSLVWFGDSLPEIADPVSLARSISLATAPAKLDRNIGISLFPVSATGYLGSPALAGHRGRSHFAPTFTTTDVNGDNLRLVISLHDAVANLSVDITLQLDTTSSVLSITTSLTNLGDAYSLDWLASATIPLSGHDSECLSLHGRWGGEFQMTRQPITQAGIQIENRSGRSSHEQIPAIVCGEPGFTDSSGLVLGMQLAWSGNYSTRIERLGDGDAYLQTGVLTMPGEQLLAEGETWAAPTAYFCRSTGLNTMSQRFHRFARQQILPGWTRTPRPIHANSWEALYFDHDANTLIELIDAAADLGAERFVLDDGWFTGRRDDTAGLGDWFVDDSIYPEGLHPVVNKVRERGMQFGLWFEPEMINPDSQLFRANPHWTLHVNGYETPLARNQLVLNLNLQEVQDYLFDRIVALIEEYNIDYIKWDMNRDLVLAGDGQRSVALAQPTDCYALMHRINQRFPELEIESCSSGGARTDLGILAHTGRIWTSDNIDPIDRLRIQRGFSLFFPPEIMGAHVGHNTAHLTGRVTNLHTRAIVALQGQFGYEFDARELDADDRKILSAYTTLYKQNRHWIAEATSWRIPTRNASLFVSGLVSEDRSNSLWSVVTERSLAEVYPETLVLDGLAPDSIYTITLVSQNLNDLGHYAKQMPEWMQHTLSLPGAFLMSTGLTLPVLPAQCGVLVSCIEKTT